MANVFIETALRLLGSRKPTSLMLLRDISQVTVLLDADAPDCAEAELAVRKYFALKGIQLIIRPVRARKPIRVHRDTQVLLSLVPCCSWRLEYVLRRSRAAFKIGRFQLGDGVLDLVVSDPVGSSYPQTEVFARMMEILEGLK